MSTRSVHTCILTKLSPVVKSVAGYFLCIGGIRFDLTDCVVSVVLDQMRIDGTYKETSLRKSIPDRLMITSRILHHNPGISFKRSKVLGEIMKILGLMSYVKGFMDDDTAWLQDSNRASSL